MLLRSRQQYSYEMLLKRMDIYFENLKELKLERLMKELIKP